VIIPVKNWCVPPDTITFVAPFSDVTAVLCKGDGCIPATHTLPYELNIDTADIVDDKVTIRFGKSSKFIHEWKIPAFADKFTITKFGVHGWIGLWEDADGVKYVLYGFVPDIPLGVVNVIVVSSDGKVYYAEIPSSEDDLKYIGTVDDLIIAIENSDFKNIVGSAKLAWWVPIAILIGLAGGTAAAIAYYNYKAVEERGHVIEKMDETVNSIKDLCNKYPQYCHIAVGMLPQIITTGMSVLQIPGGSHEGTSWLDKLMSFFKQWIAPIAGLIALIVILFKWRIIVDIFRDLIETFRRRR